MRGVSISVLAAASVAVIAGVLPSGGACAHPHVSVEVDAKIVIVEGSVTAIRFAWHFGSDYVEGLAREFDANRDGLLSDEELKPWLAQAAATLKTHAAFTRLEHGAAAVRLAPPTEVHFEQHAGGLILGFVVALAAPADVRRDALRIDVYDPSFFTYFSLDGGRRITVAGNTAGECIAAVSLAPQGRQQRAITAFTKIFGSEAKLPPAEAIAVTCKP